MNTGSSFLNIKLKEAITHSKNINAKRLLKKEADPNTETNKNGKTILMEAVSAYIPNISLIRQLIDYCADIYLRKTKEGRNALFYACQRGSLKSIQILHESGADIKSDTIDNTNLLNIAALNNICRKVFEENYIR